MRRIQGEEEEVVQGGGSGRFLVVPNMAPATVPFPSAALHAPSQEAEADPVLSGLARGVANSCSQASMQLGSDRPGSTSTTWTPATSTRWESSRSQHGAAEHTMSVWFGKKTGLKAAASWRMDEGEERPREFGLRKLSLSWSRGKDGS
ncbi:hypothetical protein MUK42_15781 [Musa troglodytarum]|uniref:Uncharacterized protein n=1 Tax=Musa troglodytarum TaxID=320322 RepID=A0A9E7HB13_9LILI|nr:hypothetical protein MUK42_15781 [Musa troglodytarum]